MSPIIRDALSLPNGARFYRCALQVNPYEYLVRHNKQHPCDEETYNKELVEALISEGIEVIAVTDHYRIRGSEGLITAARQGGITVFPGFEASTSEGIHILCLFDTETPFDAIQARINECGIHGDASPSPLGNHSAADLLGFREKWGMQCVAAHVTMKNGLLTMLQGQARAALWRDDRLMAAGIPGAVENATQEFRNILLNKEPEYKRDRIMAFLNCSDVCSAEDVGQPGASCWIKMTTPSLEGLRQSFLDPESRVRLISHPALEEHIEFVAIAWETAGFASGLKLHLNENLNVLIGGRGSGKSTIIESIRYVLELPPIGPEAGKVHESIVSNVLRSGTKISLFVRSYRPNRRSFVIERTVGNPAAVRDAETGDALPLKPSDIVSQASVYGQNEIAELARSPEKLTQLLRRFTSIDREAESKYRSVRKNLEETRQNILALESKLVEYEELLAQVPSLEETLERYRDAGVEERLQDQDRIVREEGIIGAIESALLPFDEIIAQANTLLPISQEMLSDEELADLPSRNELLGLRATITNFEDGMRQALSGFSATLSTAQASIQTVSELIQSRKAAAQTQYEKILRELQKDKIDGAEFVRLRSEIERLRPLRNQKARTENTLSTFYRQRRNELLEWEDLKREAFERLQRAAKKLGRELDGCLRVKVTHAGDKQALIDLLKSNAGGRLAETTTALLAKPDLSVSALARACRTGAEALTREFGVPAAQAQRLAGAGSELPMLIEELDLQATTDIELNVAPENGDLEWRPLKELSTGQKATAMLYLLLLESDAPLVIDQLEDNLDNRFISDGIVPRIKVQKRRRQFIFATHNANIPVLGDAELIIGCSAVGDPGDGRVAVTPQHTGSIDRPDVAVLVREILEGGREAFMTRRMKYGF